MQEENSKAVADDVPGLATGINGSCRLSHPVDLPDSPRHLLVPGSSNQ